MRQDDGNAADWEARLVRQSVAPARVADARAAAARMAAAVSDLRCSPLDPPNPDGYRRVLRGPAEEPSR